jgi:DNA helicase MCM8
MGKSQMLQAVATVAPRGVYVCGNTTTSAGLTVSIHRDAVTHDYALEAGLCRMGWALPNPARFVRLTRTTGALVLADQGTCCIDEFDKMGAEHQSLLEGPRECGRSGCPLYKGADTDRVRGTQRWSSRASALPRPASAAPSQHARASLPPPTLPAATTSRLSCRCPRRWWLGSHGPRVGVYSKSKTVSENLKMGAALLSRFDLIYVLVDRPDARMDRYLSEHVVAVRAP